MILNVRKLNITLNDNHILKDVSFEIPKGSITGFIGENGSGKSTTMKAIANLIFPEPGMVSVAGFDVAENSHEALDKLSAMIEDPAFFENLSGLDNLLYFTQLRGIDESIALAHLNAYALTGSKKRKVKHFSIGMRKRLALCIALSYEAELYILDEPFSGLDQTGIATLMQELEAKREEGKSFLISSHQLSELANVTDRNIYIDHGTTYTKLGK